MRFITYSALVDSIGSILGYEKDQVPDVTWKLWRQLISDRMTFIWRQDMWPDISKIEERTVTTAASTGDFVPFTEESKWTIGEVAQIWDADPINMASRNELSFLLEEHGITIPNGDTSVWVHYRRVKPELTGDFYDASKTYAAGEQVYDPTTGDFYDALLSNAPTHDFSDGTRWERIRIPLTFKQYIVRGVAADYYKHNGEFDKSRELEPYVEQALDFELMNLKRIQNQRKSYGMARTFVSNSY
tara:strand:- start:14800 stop:15531 length:732 start_codon:yes stop_codon:yes gene_type:complete